MRPSRYVSPVNVELRRRGTSIDAVQVVGAPVPRGVVGVRASCYVRRVGQAQLYVRERRAERESRNVGVDRVTPRDGVRRRDMER